MSDTDSLMKRMDEYDQDHCWQYDIRVRNLEDDLIEADMTKEEMQALKVSDFDFYIVTDVDERMECVEFIKRHEWLGTLSQYTTHWFAARYKGKLAGVLLFNVPNAFSKVVGDKTKDIERLISRGACISWSPKTLASSFLMYSIRWMVECSEYRVFSAYSDPSARELGTVYQACSFYYIGNTYGAKGRLVNPFTGKLVSDRAFRHKTMYRRIAKSLGIEWVKDWNHKNGMNWHNVPDEVEKVLKAESKRLQSVAHMVSMPSKHKYIFVLGRDKRETKALRKEFEERNKVYPYPKERGK